MKTARRKLSKLDLPPRRGEFDWILKDIQDEVARQAPPLPPEEPPQRPQRRVVVNIEVNQARRRPGPSRTPWARSWSAWKVAVFIWMVVAGVLALASIGKAETWTSQQQGFTTRYQGSDGSSGLSYRQGFMEHLEVNRPDGSTQRCRSYQQGFQTITECDK